MPRSVKKPCGRAPACGALVEQGVKFCPAHKQHEPERQYDRERGSASSRGYGADWRRIRMAHLRREPLCRECAKAGDVTAGTDVDHIKARARGGTDAEENLQTLCHRHHSMKTVREDGGGWKGTGANA